MLKTLSVIAGIATLAGCVSAPPPEQRIFVRTDGQSVKENPTLMQQFEIDRAICIGETQRAGMSAAPVYTDSFIEAAMIDNVRQGQAMDIAIGCMAGRGYVSVPISQATTKSAELKAASAAGAVGTKPAGSN